MDSREFRVAYAGIPLHADLPLSDIKRQGNGSQDTGRLSASGRGIIRQALALAVDAEHFSLTDQALTNSWVYIAEHGADYDGIGLIGLADYTVINYTY